MGKPGSELLLYRLVDKVPQGTLLRSPSNAEILRSKVEEGITLRKGSSTPEKDGEGRCRRTGRVVGVDGTMERRPWWGLK